MAAAITELSTDTALKSSDGEHPVLRSLTVDEGLELDKTALLKEIKALNLEPRTEFEVNGVKMYASRPFMCDDNRVGFLLYVPSKAADGSLTYTPRPVYLSDSRGVFQVPSHIQTNGYLGKGKSGFSKVETVLPTHTQAALHKALAAAVQDGFTPGRHSSSPCVQALFRKLAHKTVDDFERTHTNLVYRPDVTASRSPTNPVFTTPVCSYPVTLLPPNPVGIGRCHALVYTNQAGPSDPKLLYTLHCMNTDKGFEYRLANIQEEQEGVTPYGLSTTRYAFANEGFIEYGGMHLRNRRIGHFEALPGGDADYVRISQIEGELQPVLTTLVVKQLQEHYLAAITDTPFNVNEPSSIFNPDAAIEEAIIVAGVKKDATEKLRKLAELIIGAFMAKQPKLPDDLDDDTYLLAMPLSPHTVEEQARLSLLMSYCRPGVVWGQVEAEAAKKIVDELLSPEHPFTMDECIHVINDGDTYMDMLINMDRAIA